MPTYGVNEVITGRVPVLKQSIFRNERVFKKCVLTINVRHVDGEVPNKADTGSASIQATHHHTQT